MPNTTPALSITLSGIASLAHVQRPVVSMWRSRSANADEPFPPPTANHNGQELFNADQVARWLVDTKHGNNPDAVADAAAHATLPEVGSDDVESFDALTALIALRAAHGATIGTLGADELLDLADAIDPDDECLAREVENIGEQTATFARFVDVLVDGAYSAPSAFENVMAARFRDRRRELVSSTLSARAVDLVATAVRELAATNPAAPAQDEITVVDPTGAAGDLLVGVVAVEGEDVDLTLITADHEADAARLLRRRLLAHGVLRRGLAVHESGEFAVSGPVVHVAQYPSPAHHEQSPREILTAIESTVLQMDDAQRGVVIAPATVLTDGKLPADAAEIRSALLRSGRIRAIVRLPVGLLPSSPRRSLALWVLGPAHASVALAERWTMVADLSSAALTGTVTTDLVSDLVAAMGDRATVRAHAFRFARLVFTSALLARIGSLVSRTSGIQHTPEAATAVADASERAATAVRVEALLTALGASTPVAPERIEAAATARTLSPTPLGDLAADRHVRYVAGTRVQAEDIGTGNGFAIIGTDELTGAYAHGTRTIERLLLGSRYPAARLTEPGDVVFCTGPRPLAWVDHDGSSVVVYPARVLHINSQDPAGLVPEVLAADIESAPSGMRDWRRWMARRVLPGQSAPLTDALAGIRREREVALARLAHLDGLSTLLTHGVTTGALTITSPLPVEEAARGRLETTDPILPTKGPS